MIMFITPLFDEGKHWVLQIRSTLDLGLSAQCVTFFVDLQQKELKISRNWDIRVVTIVHEVMW